MATEKPTPNSLTRDTVALRRGIVLVPAGDGRNQRLAASLQAELMQFGFMLDAAAFEAVGRAPREWIVTWHNEVITYLRKRLGADRSYQPFYRNFPTEVMETSHFELFLNALVHYWLDGKWEPPQPLRPRGFAFEDVEFKLLRQGTEDDLKRAFTSLTSINQSLTEQDKETIEWLIETYGKEALTLPAAVPFKETLCLLAAKGFDVPVATPTDVLRIAVYLSGGDVSLPAIPKVTASFDRYVNAQPDHLKKFVTSQPQAWRDHFDRLRDAQQKARDAFKFKKFSRTQRRRLLELLERSNADPAEMQRHLGRWVRLGEVLHPGEFAARYPRAAKAFDALRNQSDGKKVRTFAARVDLAFKRNWREGVELLATRPGEFARALDWMLRTFDDRRHMLEVFARVAPSVSTKVLFELYNHFAARIGPGMPRIVMLKGKRARMKTLSPLPPMDADLVQNVGNTILAIFRDGIRRLPPMGKVWIDERLRDVPVPFSMRSINPAVRTYVRGTRIPFRREAKVVRAFIHWNDDNGTEDLDLSVTFFDDKLRRAGHVSFTKLKDDRFNCCHSGDIRHRKGPCAEYVDIDVQRCLAEGVRYVAVQVFNYEARPMHTVKECVFGLMEREHPAAGEIFVPKTISNCMGLANEGTSVVVCLIDLKDGNYIWADLESQRALPTLEHTANQTAEVLHALVYNTKMSVYELLAMHAQLRGTLVTSASESDVALHWEAFATDYAKVAEYMT